MQESMYKYMKVGLIHFMAYPEVMKGEGPILETLQKIAEGNLAIFLATFSLFSSSDVDLSENFLFKLNASLYFLLDVSSDDYEDLYFLWPIVCSTNKEKLPFYFLGRYCMNNSSKNMAKTRKYVGRGNV